MDDFETDGIEASASRRALIKGAVAAGIGVAAYSAPSISKVPVYATHGLSSWSEQSSAQCVWWSPNRNGGNGEWADDSGTSTPGGTQSGFGTRTASVAYTIAGQTVNVGFMGSPNNTTNGTDGAFYDTGTTPTPGSAGMYRGAFISIDNVNCELVVSEVNCNKCSEGASTALPAAWTAGNVQGNQTIQYKTNRFGNATLGTKGDSGRCKLSIRYKVRCRP